GGVEFFAIPTEQPTPGACFAYPAHVTLMGAPALAAPQQPVPTASRPPHQPSFIPWLFAVAGVALSVGVVLGVSAIWPRPQASQSANTTLGAQGPTYREEPAAPGSAASPVNVAPTQSGSSEGVTPAPAAPAAAAPASETPPQATPPEWEPSRQLWRSSDAQSGLPPRLLPSPPELKWVLAIGIGAYQDPALAASGAAQDAMLAANALRQNAAVPPDHVRVLTDGQATRDGVKQAFKWLQQSASSGKDTVYLYLTGTALIAPDRSDLKHAGGTGYALLPHDTRLDNATAFAIYGADLAAWLGATAAQTVVLVVDTNHAGACDLPEGADAGRGIALLASAGAVQQGRTRRSQQVGLFAELFSQAIAGAADRDRDGRVALSELKPHLELEMGRATLGAQTVDLRGGFGGQIPDLHFATVRR
ncbi:MAG: caspase family protein, partial [Actinomycetota bacterium]